VESNNASFVCVATALPRPNITWWRRDDSHILTLIADDDKYSIDERPSGERQLQSDLTIFDTETQDTGTYVCTAENPTGHSDSAEAYLTVHGNLEHASITVSVRDNV